MEDKKELKKRADKVQPEEATKVEDDNSFDFAFVGGGGPPLSQIMSSMSGVDLNSSEAQSNASSISDNNGGRIELDFGDENITKK